MDALTNELVGVITGFSAQVSSSHEIHKTMAHVDIVQQNAARFKLCKEAASRDLRHHRLPRTNQFEIRNSLEGLVEKFHVLNNEPLAERLEEELLELGPKSTSWTPEVLSLFLLLSDDPVTKTDLNITNSQKAQTTTPPLTWNDVLAEDPYTEDGIWDEVDFRAGSEDEDVSSLRSSASSEHTTETRRSSYTDENSSVSAESFLLPVQQLKLDNFMRAQKSAKDNLTELQVVRQTLHMLLGLPTSLYARQTTSGQVVVRLQDTIPGFSKSALLDLLQQIASIGTDVGKLRDFIKKRQSIPLLETFSASVDDKLNQFDQEVTEIEKSLVDIKTPTVVSLIGLESHMNTLYARLSYLLEVVMVNYPVDISHELLDELFSHVSMAQATGDTEAFIDITNTFLRCLRTYLKPLSTWMEEGGLHGSATSLPFISNSKVDISSFWQDRYSMTLDVHGNPKVPKFLQGVIAQIFASGKSVAYMKELGLTIPLLTQPLPEATVLSFTSICGADPAHLMLPFSNLLDTTLKAWVAGKHHHTWLTIRPYLHRPNDGLVTIVNALSHLFLSADGSLTTAFHSAIFAKLDAGKSTWRDSFFLEDQARSCFSLSTSIDARKIVRNRDASILPTQTQSATPRKDFTVKALSAVATSLTYIYPSHIHNIIPPTTALPIYRAVSTLLLQLYRPIYLITQHRLLRFETRQPRIQSRNIHAQTYLLRHTLLNTLTTLRSHLINSSMAPASSALHASIATAASLDETITAHAAFMTRLEQSCLLVRQVDSVRVAVLSLADLGILFASLVERWHDGNRGRNTTRQKNVGGESESSDESDEETEDSNGQRRSNAPLTEQEVSVRLKQMTQQHDQLLAFIVAGLRSAARGEGGDGSWGVLAEILEWGIKGKSL